MSLKGDKYETWEEINFRLTKTVVLYDGKPVYITQVSMPDDGGKEIARVHFVELPYKMDRYEEGVGKQAQQRKYLSSRNFDLAPFKMGYMNYKGEALFVSRNPVRQNRQGLSAEATVITDVKGKPSAALRFSAMISSDGFVDMFSGKYPDFKDVGGMLGDKENSSVAVSRTFAFVIDHDLEALLLMHKGTKCGIALKDDKALRLPPKYHFLRQECEEFRIPLA